MNITGIITEYNPFHNGHLYHLNSAKSTTNCDGIICIMSGNFVQRGGPAIIDKWKRADMAISNGIDLVLEMPTFYSLSSAEYFARGSLSILDSLGVVSNIFFGSESGNVEDLIKISKILIDEPIEFKQELKNNLNKGLTFAKAREISLSKILNNTDLSKILASSNNILGIEYIKSILRLNSSIKPLTIKREGSSYNDKDLNSTFSSATSIREYINTSEPLQYLKECLPNNSFEILNTLYNENYPFIFEEDMFKFIQHRLFSNCVNFNNLPEIIEGLDNKLLKELVNSTSLNEFILRVKSKRYTYSKISRILTQIYVGMDSFKYEDLIDVENLYARVLGFNDKGKNILKVIKKNSSIPIITKVQKHLNNPLLQLDIQATKNYSLLNNKLNPHSDFLISPIIK